MMQFYNLCIQHSLKTKLKATKDLALKNFTKLFQLIIQEIKNDNPYPNLITSFLLNLNIFDSSKYLTIFNFLPFLYIPFKISALNN